MRRSRALCVAAAGTTLALVAACTSGSTTTTTNSGSPGTGGGGGSTAPGTTGGQPLNTNPGSGSPVKGGTLHMLGVGDVDYMDPNLVYYTAGSESLRLWSRQLVTYPAVPGKVTTDVPDLATQLPTTSNGGISADGKTYKLTIKTGAKWDTTPPRQVTAADEVRGVKRTCNPAQPFGGMPDFENLIVGLAAYCAGFAKVNGKSASAIAGYQNTHNIAGVTVDPSNPQTVVFKLVSPASYFLPMLSMSAFSPSPVEYDKYIPGSAQLATHTIADGPYKVTKYVATKSISYVRNPAWSASTDSVRKAYVDAVEVNETGNQDAIQQQMEANTSSADMEWDTFPPITAIPGLIAKKDPNLNVQPTYSSNPFVIFNTVSPNNGSALKKAAVRRALSEGISRDHIIQAIGGPLVNPPLTHILPAGISGIKNSTSPNPFPYDAAKAKKDLAAAGLKSGATLKFLYRPDSSSSKAIFITMQQDLSKLGLKIVGVPASNADFYVKYLQVPDVAKRGTWDVSLAGWGPDWYGDAAKSYFSPLYYGNGGKAGSAFPPNGSDYGFYDNPAVDKLIVQASAEPDPAKSSALWTKADNIVTNDAAIFPITTNNQATYHASHVHNTVFIPSIQQIDPANVWLSKS